MPIYFACTHCKKSLFAQDIFAGRAIVCPACATRNVIPQPPTPDGDAQVVDMEAAPIEPAPVLPTPPVSPLNDRGNFADAASIEQNIANPGIPTPTPPTLNTGLPETAAAAAPEPVKKCPLCAETIKAAARKCRYCGAILDEDLRKEEEQQRREQVVGSMLALAERSAQIWRALSVIATGCTIGWLTLITAPHLVMLILKGQGPWMLVLFNLLLIVGLFWSMRQMKHGPHPVFLSSAVAIMLCMPLGISLGLPLYDPEQLKEMQKQTPQLTAEMVETMVTGIYSFMSLLFSIPLWIATLKVAGLQRLRQNAGTKR